MRRLLLLLFLAAYPDALHAQWWFRIRQEYHPTQDSLCWAAGREDDIDFFFSPGASEEIIFRFGITSHVKLSTVVGDSAWLTLDDGYVLRLRNSVNSQPKRDRPKLFGQYVPELEYDYFLFTAPIRREDLSKLATEKLRSLVIHLHSPGVNLAMLLQAPRNAFVSRRFHFDMTNRRVDVYAKTLHARFRRIVKRTARRAEKWLQKQLAKGPGSPRQPSQAGEGRKENENIE